MSQLATQHPRQHLNADGRRRLVTVFGMVGLFAALLFISAGSLRWWNAWAYLGLYLAGVLIGGLYVARVNPATINERGRKSEKTKPFDKLFGVLTVPLHLSIFVIAGLDFRFGWTTLPLWSQIIGFVGMLPGFIVPYWVMLVNAYAATTVRVETDRGQHVITTGPYRTVRHPLYSATLLSYLFSPLAFDSWWVAVPVALLIGLFVWRTAREDKTLLAELPGYADYAQQTRYRLVPGIW
jgi:protein-S-isoprenylcysteine O-methyltransferase Ste14